MDEKNINNTRTALELSRNAYNEEKQRTTVIDAKVSIMMVLLSGLLIFSVGYFQISETLEASFNTIGQAIKSILEIFSALGSISCVIVSIIIMISIVSTAEYVVLDSKKLISIEKISENEEIYNLLVANLYVDALNHNTKINDRRVKRYQLAIILAVISIVLCAIYYGLRIF